MACSIAGAKILQKMWEGPYYWEGVWPCLDPWDVVRLRTSSSCWNVQGKYGAARRAFLLPYQGGAGGSHVKPVVSAETLKTCALIGLHLLAAEGEAGSSGGQSLDFGDAWRYGCPQSPDWDSDGESWSESEGLSSSVFREHNVKCLALNVIGQNWSGEKVSLVLEDWELAEWWP